MAEDALNRTLETERRVTQIEVGLGGVADSIVQTRENVVEASEELDIAEDKSTSFLLHSKLAIIILLVLVNAVPSVELFLNATREAVDQFVFNISTFIAENDRIIGEIDDIIAGLADIHSRVNKVKLF